VKRPWLVTVDDGVQMRYFATFQSAEKWAKKRSLELFDETGFSRFIDIGWYYSTVARIKVDPLNRVWTDIIVDPVTVERERGEAL
jgi:hypothetical protein